MSEEAYDISQEDDFESPSEYFADENLAYTRLAKKHVEIEESESNWLVSYADMMTLLVGFFAMLLAFSKIDSVAFEKIKKETTKIFGGEYQIPFEKLSEKLKDVIAKSNLTDQVVLTETDRGIDVTFKGSLFFASGSAELLPKAKSVLLELLPVIQTEAKGFGVLVEGHTDNVPIQSKMFASNWELSSVRACTVVRLFEEKGFSKNRLKALGWGDTQPILPNESKEGKALPHHQAQNRRIVIKILRHFSTD